MTTLCHSGETAVQIRSATAAASPGEIVNSGDRGNPRVAGAAGRDIFYCAELATLVGGRMAHYNTDRRHSRVGYVSHLTYIERARAGSVGDRRREYEQDVSNDTVDSPFQQL